jgi:hypothetical protein
MGFNLTPVARWVNIQLFGLLIFIIGFVSLKTMRDTWFAAIPAWLIAISPIILPVYSWAMAEPLTLALGFAGLAIIIWKLNKPEPLGNNWVVFPGLLLGLSAAARYSAVAFLATGLLICFFWSDSPVKKRFFSALIMGLVGILPMALWVVVQVGQTASVSSRTILSSTEMVGRFTAFWPQLNSAVLVWLVPASFLESAPYPAVINLVLPAGMMAAMIGSTFWLLIKRDNTPFKNLVNSLWLFSGLYLLVILLVYLTTYPPITIDNRMLSPVHTAVIWIAGLLISDLFIRFPTKLARSFVMLAAVFLIGWYGIRTIRIVQQNADTGLGYNAANWKESPLIARIKKLDKDAKITSNEQMAILYLTGRITSPLAEIYFTEPLKEFPRYGDGQPGADPVQDEFRKGKSYLVLFDTLKSQLESIYNGQADQRAKSLSNNLNVVFSSSDGEILQYPVQ